MRLLKNKIIIVISVLLYSISFSNPKITPTDLNLSIKNGNIDINKMTAGQKDTIVISQFNPEDNYFDIAVLYKSRNEIVIYRNEVNGYLSEYRAIPIEISGAERIEAIRSSKSIFPEFKSSLKIYFGNGSEKVIPSQNIINKDRVESKAPVRNFLDNPKAFVYPLEFIEVWRSMSSTVLSYYSVTGDIDRDGKNEIIYTFYPYFPANEMTRLVVFESIGNNNFRIDWDTLLTEGGEICNKQIVNFEKNNNREFFAFSYMNLLGRLTLGLFECSGEGKYRFYHCGLEEMAYGFPYTIEVKDTLTSNNTTNIGIWVCYGRNEGLYERTFINKYTFTGKNYLMYSFTPGEYGQSIKSWYFSYDMKVADIDKDGKEELVLGDAQFGTNYISYLDSTGISTNYGYSFKTLIPNAPISAGNFFTRDFDSDGIKELITCGVCSGRGGIGVIKHTGTPGSNQFTTMWWDSVGIHGGPINGIDSGYIDGKFSIVHPALRSNPGYYQTALIYIYSYLNNYNLFKSSFKSIDSSGMIQPHLIDIEKIGKTNLIAPQAFGYSGNYNDFIVCYKQIGSIGINNNNTEVPKDYVLYQNYPNPFNSRTKIRYQLLKKGIAELIFYDITGKEIKYFSMGKNNIGIHEYNFEAGNLSSEIYFYSLFVEGIRIDTKKAVLLK